MIEANVAAVFVRRILLFLFNFLRLFKRVIVNRMTCVVAFFADIVFTSEQIDFIVDGNCLSW